MTFEMILLENRMAGRAEGIAEGRAENEKMFVLKMLQKGKTFEEIHELIEIPIERIKELAALSK